MSKEPVVIVTGASRGLGAAAARWLATAGAAITLVARSAEMLAEVAEDIRRLGGRPLFALPMCPTSMPAAAP